MKKMHYSFLGIILYIVLTSAILKFEGSPGGYSNSPGDARNCTSCHMGSVIEKMGMITTDIPPEGYTPEIQYKISVTLSGQNSRNAGFELTAENENNSKIGTFATIPDQGTYLFDFGKSVTHTYYGISQKKWDIFWTAPTQRTGKATFYVSVLAGDGQTDTSNDQVFTSSLGVTENISNGITETKLFPAIYFDNYSKNLVINSQEPSQQVNIYTLSGTKVKSFEITNKTLYTFSLSDLSSQNYLIVLGTGKNKRAQKIIIQ